MIPRPTPRALTPLLALVGPALPGDLAVRAGHQEEVPVIRTQDAARAGPDFPIQGEYVGSLLRDGDPEMFGVQVIALGKGSFEARGLRGGLPGAGWDRKAKLELAGQAREGGAVLESADGAEEELRLSIRAGRMTVHGPGGAELGHLVRVVRKSPTLGLAPPPGATVLFDGSSAERFVTGRGEPAQMTDDGVLRQTRGSGGLFTRAEFGDGRLHLEFRLPFEPEGRGQGRANSGCYVQGRYEVQILDSFGLEGLENQCGGVYSSGLDPRVNMCFPPLSWQTYDIDFTAARFDESGEVIAHAKLSVLHNGVEIYRDLEIDHLTTAAPFGREGPVPLPGLRPHFFQDHGHELHFRNVWVLER